MHHGRLLVTGMIVAVALGSGTRVRAAWAEGIEAGISVGYANLSLDDSASELDGQGGFRMEPRLTWRPFAEMPELGIGFATAISFYRADLPEPTGGSFFGETPEGGFEEMTLIVPELQFSWRQRIAQRWTIEGGVGVGGAFADYSAGDIIVDNFVVSTLSDDDAALSVHPFLRAGYGRDKWTVGVDAGYLWTDIDFGRPVGGGLSEWSVGFFATSRQ